MPRFGTNNKNYIRRTEYSALLNAVLSLGFLMEMNIEFTVPDVFFFFTKECVLGIRFKFGRHLLQIYL